MSIVKSPQSRTERSRRLLAALARSTAGNSMIIVAAAMVPIAGVVGGGFDMGRAYLAKSKLQSACDAGALAGRRTMNGNAWTAATSAAADAYFGVNFVAGKFGTTNLTKSFALAADRSTVTGTASVVVPTTLMKIFGKDQIPLSVVCDAVMKLPNTDVMFVLDTTGSMNENASDGQPKITGLRSAITNFYNALETAKSPGTQVRYGFVPYSTTVNVGYLLNRDWMVDQWTYQSRIPDGSTSSTIAGATNVPQVTNSNWTQTSPVSSRTWSYSNLNLEACVQPADTVVWGDTVVDSDTTSANAASNDGMQRVRLLHYTADGIRYALSQTATTCQLTTETFTGFVEQYTETTIIVDTVDTVSTTNFWNYQPVTYDVSSLKGRNSGGSITAPIGAGHVNRTVDWQGCIEERNTARATDYSSIPGGALDMNIDLVPTAGNPSTQWRPALPSLVFARSDLNNSASWSVPNVRSQAEFPNVGDANGGQYAVCPTESRKLSSLSANQLSTYLASLTPKGATYHDIGLIWGARLISPTGLFASENAATPSGGQITRHLIFMTDGETNTDPKVYDSYGWPALDRRRVMDPTAIPIKSDQDALVAARTSAMCEAIKAKGITVWVIAFGTSITPMLSDCATDTAHVFDPTSAAALNTAFTNIASQIANLRLKR